MFVFFFFPELRSNVREVEGRDLGTVFALYHPHQSSVDTVLMYHEGVGEVALRCSSK